MACSDFLKTVLNTSAAAEFLTEIRKAIRAQEYTKADELLGEILQALKLNPAEAKRLSYQPDLAALEEAINAACPPEPEKGDRIKFDVLRNGHYWRVQATAIRSAIPITDEVRLILEEEEQWPAKFDEFGARIAENLANAKDPSRRRNIRAERERARQHQLEAEAAELALESP